MPIITWSPRFSVGVEHLDKEHQTLVDTLNILHDSMRSGEGKQSLNAILLNLIDYTATHFKSEEELFDKYNFPETAEHKEEHEKFVQQVLSFKEDFDASRVFITLEVMDFLKNWLLNHILGSDKGYGPFLNKLGVN